jgi:hypothetical protein
MIFFCDGELLNFHSHVGQVLATLATPTLVILATLATPTLATLPIVQLALPHFLLLMRILLMGLVKA